MCLFNILRWFLSRICSKKWRKGGGYNEAVINKITEEKKIHYLCASRVDSYWILSRYSLGKFPDQCSSGVGGCETWGRMSLAGRSCGQIFKLPLKEESSKALVIVVNALHPATAETEEMNICAHIQCSKQSSKPTHFEFWRRFFSIDVVHWLS